MTDDFYKKITLYLKKNFLWNKITNPQDISGPIVKAIKEKETLNPNKITEPIVNELGRVESGLDDIKNAVESQRYPEIVAVSNFPEMPDNADNFQKLGETIREEIKKLDKEVVVKNDLGQLLSLFKSNKDKGDILKVLKEIRDKKDTEYPLPTDYTLLLSDIIDAIEKKDFKLPDLSKIENDLQEIKDKETFKIPDNLIKDDRIKVEVDRAGGGWFPDEFGVLDTSGNRINPATEAKQDDMITAINAISGAWEATSTSIVTAGSVKTITETDGVKTKTTVIDSTDPNDKQITTAWT